MHISTKKWLLALPSVLLIHLLSAQNLVPNPSFEDGSCVVNYNSTPAKIPTTINNWYSANGASPDPFDSCGTAVPATAYPVIAPNVIFGYQYARTGYRFMGLGFYAGPWYEYIGVKLTQPLEAGEVYNVSFWVACADNMLWAADQIGMYFSTTDISYPTTTGSAVFNYTPQVVNAKGNFLKDTTWQQIAGNFVAAGGEQYIVIGYFKPVVTADFYLFPNPGNGLKQKANPNYQPTVAGTGTASAPRSYYYIDDVSVMKAPANGSLPVGLTGFSAKISDQQVKLNWSTQSENNNCSFDIERSSDGSSFTAIGKSAGAVNSSVTLNYSFNDPHPLSGKSYYRLKQNDCDGKYTYSKIIAVNNNTAGFSVYPNPAADNLIIDRNKAGVAIAAVYDFAGRKIKEQAVAAAKENIAVADLLPGTYIIKIQTGQETVSQKFIKK